MASMPHVLAAQDVTCHPGDTEVRRLQFTGNRAYADEALANAIVTTPSSWTRRALGIFGTRRCLDRAEFPRDRLRLIIFYRNHGYIDVQVDTAVRPVRRGVADVQFGIREGRPVLIDSLTIAGLDSLAPERARPDHQTVAGPNRRDLRQDRDRASARHAAAPVVECRPIRSPKSCGAMGATRRTVWPRWCTT